jgi:hypothetical protein
LGDRLARIEDGRQTRKVPREKEAPAMHDAERLQAKLNEIEARYEADFAAIDLRGAGLSRLVLLPSIFLMVALSVLARGEALPIDLLYAFGLAVLVSAGFQVATWLVMKGMLAWRARRRAMAR